MRRTAPRIGLLAALAAGTVACGHGAPLRTTLPPGMYALPVNGQPVPVPIGVSLLEALGRTPWSSLAIGFGSVSGAPLYVIDGVPVNDGLTMLRTLRACEAATVEVLRPLDAVTRWGTRAGAGAVVVATRRGDTPGSC